MRHTFLYSIIVFRLGGIFHEDNSAVEIAFRNAILRENMDNTKLEFIPLVRRVDPEDSFEAEKIGLLTLNVLLIWNSKLFYLGIFSM